MYPCMDQTDAYPERTTIDFILFGFTSCMFFLALAALIVGAPVLAAVGVLLTATGLGSANLREIR